MSNSSISSISDREERHAEQRYELFIRRHLNRNFAALLLHGMLGQTGFRFISAPTFVPAYLLMLSEGSSLVVGLALSLQGLGTMITPFIGANLISHRRRVLPIGFITGSLMRICVLLIGLAGIWFEPRLALVSIIITLFLFGAFEGMQGVIFNYLGSKVIPVSKRGRLTGLRNFLAGITSATVAYLGGTYLIGESGAIEGYSWTFILAFVVTSIGLCMLLIVREPEPPTVRAPASLWQRLGEVPALMSEDKAFSRYVIARAIATMGRMAMPFYILYAGQTIGLSGTTLGIVTLAFAMTGTISNLIWGVAADAKGFRLVFLLASILWILSTALLMLTSTLLATAVVFAGIGAAVQGFENASRNMVLEFGDRDNLPMRIALANTAAQLAGTIGPISGGILATWLNYEAVFIVAIIFIVLGSTLVYLFVPEPRTRIQDIRTTY